MERSGAFGYQFDRPSFGRGPHFGYEDPRFGVPRGFGSASGSANPFGYEEQGLNSFPDFQYGRPTTGLYGDPRTVATDGQRMGVHGDPGTRHHGDPRTRPFGDPRNNFNWPHRGHPFDGNIDSNSDLSDTEHQMESNGRSSRRYMKQWYSANGNVSQCTLCWHRVKPLAETEVLECGHLYHRLCLKELFGVSQTEQQNVFCAQCRQDIDKDLAQELKKRFIDAKNKESQKI